MTGREDNYIFDAQHLTSRDIAKLEDALSMDDLEVLVAAVDAILGLHLETAGKRKRGAR